jgi:hypothetical protein
MCAAVCGLVWVAGCALKVGGLEPDPVTDDAGARSAAPPSPAAFDAATPPVDDAAVPPNDAGADAAAPTPIGVADSGLSSVPPKHDAAAPADAADEAPYNDNKADE